MKGCDRFERDGMRYIDGEIGEHERKDFELHCAECVECREQLARYKELDDLTRRVKMVDPMDEFWEKYWRSLYRRMERKTGWVLMLAGFAILLVYALRELVVSLREITIEEIAMLLIAAGFVVLLVSVARERYYQRKSDPYKDVRR